MIVLFWKEGEILKILLNIRYPLIGGHSGLDKAFWRSAHFIDFGLEHWRKIHCHKLLTRTWKFISKYVVMKRIYSSRCLHAFGNETWHIQWEPTKNSLRRDFPCNFCIGRGSVVLVRVTYEGCNFASRLHFDRTW